MKRAAAAVLTLLLVTGVGLARSTVQSADAGNGFVRARLVYELPQADHGYLVRLTIDRSGRRVFDNRVRPLAHGYVTKPQGLHGAKPIVLRDLDADGEPEVLLDFYSGRAHCCVWSRIYRWLHARGTYASIARIWGNVDYRITNLDRHANVELVSADDRFASAFTSYAASSDPVQIWNYRSGRLVDTTRAFPARIAVDASRQWRSYERASRQRVDVRGYLGAWAADECLLGQGAVALRTLQRLPPRVWRTFSVPELRSGSAYVTYLRGFLDRRGYAC